MSIFKKTIKYSKPSTNLDTKIKKIDEQLKKIGITIDESDVVSLCENVELNDNVEKIDWRKDIFDEKDKDEILNEEILLIKDNIENKNKVLKNVDSHIISVNEDFDRLKKEIFEDISKNFLFNIPNIERKLDNVLDLYDQIKEGLLREPPDTKNQDPLTPLNQNFATLDDLNRHYTLFINRVQEQISTVGGGGETQLRYLDDIVGIATNPSVYDGKYLKYNHSLRKFVFETAGGGEIGGQGTQGIQGLQGVGSQGTQGIQGGGSQGTQGIQGIQGVGSQGLQGDIGIQGPAGTSQGTQGTFGDQGAQGIFGNQGSQGVSEQGTQGLNGDQGVQGILGEQGVQGLQGLDGLYAGQGTQGLQGLGGDQGAQGTQGSIGDQGTQGLQGLGGDQGAQGTQGILGEQGTQGLQGIPGEYAGQGSQGLQGSQGIGDQGVQGLSNQGTQGTFGTQGSQGLQGAQGVQGTQGVNGISGSRTYSVTNSGASDYVIDGSNDPTLNLLRGFTYVFNVNASGHPFWIKTAQVTGTGSAYSSGVTNNGIDNGTITFAVPYDAPDTLYYICQFHGSMVGTISITNVGPQGTQGIQGSQGPQGTQGIGDQGAQGLSNQGTQGTFGTQGSQGTQGTQGLSNQGVQGLSNQGTQGTFGAQGSQGIQGIQGTFGAQGSQGTFGTQGSQGIQGIQGTFGAQGSQGTFGAQGSQGTQGTQGLSNQGVQGLQGTTSSFGSRLVVSNTTTSIGAGATVNLDINGYKSYGLLKVGISSAAWVVVYSDSTSRANDVSRSYLTDPIPGTGIIAEVRTTSPGISTFLITPGIIGWNNDVSVGSSIYARVTNNESSNSSITVDLTIVQLET